MSILSVFGQDAKVSYPNKGNATCHIIATDDGAGQPVTAAGIQRSGNLGEGAMTSSTWSE